jgi:hypothetical protein
MRLNPARRNGRVDHVDPIVHHTLILFHLLGHMRHTTVHNTTFLAPTVDTANKTGQLFTRRTGVRVHNCEQLESENFAVGNGTGVAPLQEPLIQLPERVFQETVAWTVSNLSLLENTSLHARLEVTANTETGTVNIQLLNAVTPAAELVCWDLILLLSSKFVLQHVERIDDSAQLVLVRL